MENALPAKLKGAREEYDRRLKELQEA